MGILKNFQLTGRRALVTGSSRGIGRAILLALAEAGADVVIHSEGDTEHAAEAAAEAAKFGGRVVTVVADLSDMAAVEGLPGLVRSRLGAPEILVLNASVQARVPWREITSASAQRQLDVNFLASLRLIQLFEPEMTARNWGRILAIGSVQQHRPHPDMLAYAASKCAQFSVVRGLAPQLAPAGITVNNLSPGVILTDRNTEALSDTTYAAQLRRKIPLGRFGNTTDCAALALLLCSEAGSYITGQNFLVDGGLSL